MTYRQAKEIVKKAYPDAVLSAMRKVGRRIQTWKGGEGVTQRLETKTIKDTDFYILGPLGRDLCNGVRTRTRATAWIQAGLILRGY